MPDVAESVSVLLSLFAGIGLASACGLRAFAPLLVLSLAARTGRVEVLEPLSWIGGGPVVGALALLSVLEILGRHGGRHGGRDVPGRLVSAVVAAMAGGLAATALLIDLHGVAPWIVGGAAGAAFALAVLFPAYALRRLSGGPSAQAGGLGTPMGETLSAVLIAALSLYAPIAAPMLVVAVVAGAVRMRRQGVNRSAA